MHARPEGAGRGADGDDPEVMTASGRPPRPAAEMERMKRKRPRG